MEANSLDTVRLHLRHVVTTPGESFPINTLDAGHLQGHIDRRAASNTGGDRSAPVTLRKEVASFRACWNWGVQAGKLKGVFPGRGLKYPKTDEKPPFQTRADIERQIGRGGLTDIEVRQLMDALFLTRPDIGSLLTHVRNGSGQPFLYPMVCLAAHTGARRSELLRLRVDDVDFATGTVLLHEKKRARGRRTSRRVPLSKFVRTVLREWIAAHPADNTCSVKRRSYAVRRGAKNRFP